MRLHSLDVYAFGALGYLGAHDGLEWIPCERISQGTGLARPFLARALSLLSQGELVRSKKGPHGGYRLARPPADLSLRQVMQALERPLAPLSCASLSQPAPCAEEDRCHARVSVHARLRDGLHALLTDMSVADLAEDARRGVRYEHCLTHLWKPAFENLHPLAIA